jgi:1,4-alpha-glucan branching enzyme
MQMMAPRTASNANRGSVDAVVHGTSADPFAVLGRHPMLVDGRAAVVLRTMQPHAHSVDVAISGTRVPMTRVRSEGLFEVSVPWDAAPDALAYRLAVRDAHGERELIDPYQFGPVLTDFDLHLFAEGTHYRAWEQLGSQRRTIGDVTGVHFSVWAPNAQRVSVVGDFNRWDGRVHPMRNRAPSGIWELFVPDLADGERYKYEIRTPGGHLLEKADPYGRRHEVPPHTASVVWTDGRQHAGGWLERPMSVYEVHLASWRRHEDGRPLSYRELAESLVSYVADMGFTHIELLPVMEHPFGGSWGYQVVGFFAPTGRCGTPDDFRCFVDACHQRGIGVILDWVPGHFPKDSHGLARFDGTALYEHVDPRKGEHREWGTLVFNYGRDEVRTFLLSNALYWLEEFHVDGLRVDAVASMLYLDYSRPEGEWVPNQHGGRENVEAVEFLKRLNVVTHSRAPGTITIAEESTSWPLVSRPTDAGGLGFTYKWNMGWMHDVLAYAKEDPVHRRWSHDRITFSMLYAFTENFVLPLSHDEVVYGKRAMLDKMPGDVWQKHATLRALYGYLFGHPGKKLMFMGCEVAQWPEWNHDGSVDWPVLGDPLHRGMQAWVRDLNRLYQQEPSLHQVDFDGAGFTWIDCEDAGSSIFSFVRRAKDGQDHCVVVVNFTPVPRPNYRVGVPDPGWYRELLNSDAAAYGGTNVGNGGGMAAQSTPAHGFAQSLEVVVPPLGCLFLKR